MAHHFTSYPVTGHVLAYITIIATPSHEYLIYSHVPAFVCLDQIPCSLHEGQLVKPTLYTTFFCWRHIATIIDPSLTILNLDSICMPVSDPVIVLLSGLGIILLATEPIRPGVLPHQVRVRSGEDEIDGCSLACKYRFLTSAP